jgi:hypothetical protein
MSERLPNSHGEHNAVKALARFERISTSFWVLSLFKDKLYDRYSFQHFQCSNKLFSRHRWSNNVLAIGSEVRVLKPSQGRYNPQHAFLRMGSKAVGPM